MKLFDTQKNFQNILRKVRRLTEACQKVGTNYADTNTPVVQNRKNPYRKEIHKIANFFNIDLSFFGIDDTTTWEKVHNELVTALPYAITAAKRAIRKARKSKASPDQISQLVRTHLLLKKQKKVCDQCKNFQKNTKAFDCPLSNQKEVWIDKDGNIRT